MFKKIISIILILILSFSFVSAQDSNEDKGFFNFDFSFEKFLNFFKFWDNQEEKDNTLNNQNTNNYNQNIVYKKPSSFNISLGSFIFDKNNLQKSINSKPDLNTYIKGFNYNCISLKTDKNTKLTFKFNTNSGKITSIKTGLSCDREIYLEESLIDDLYKNGFSAKNIKTYLEKVELPTTMYFKAIKVFTIG